VVYFTLKERNYPVPLQPPSAPEPRPKSKLEKRMIHVTVIHPNGSSTATYFPVEVSNGEDRVTINYKSL
jgi:hypothetical protein